MKEPKWLPRILVDAVHVDQIREHGGVPGVRDENILESALSRPRHKWEYGTQPDLFELSAAYGFGIARNHPYNDGNKRVAFLSMVTFLGLNGCDIDASEEEVVTVMLSLAAGTLTEKGLTKWLRDHRAPKS